MKIENKRGSRGKRITSSQARNFVRHLAQRVILIDGAELAELMISTASVSARRR